jgi:undecaprenyl-diphosphatase
MGAFSAAVAVAAVLLGVVEGLTEYIPVSSTGHLILAGDLLGFKQLVGGKDVADAFEIFIQLGAILAVVVAYPRRFAGLLRLRDNRGFSGLRGLTLLFIPSVPGGILGLVARQSIKAHLFQPIPVGIALAVGALWILAVEWRLPRTRREGVDSLDWKDALGIGLFQCLALWPGMSRSSSTIVGGMMLGVERKTATEYSFFAAVPLLTAATLYELYKSRGLLNTTNMAVFAIGFVVSFVVAWAAVKLFIRFLAHHTLVPFGWYRLAVAAVVLTLAVFGVVHMEG